MYLWLQVKFVYIYSRIIFCFIISNNKLRVIKMGLYDFCRWYSEVTKKKNKWTKRFYKTVF